MKNNLEYECQLKDIEIQNMNKTVNELKNQLKIIGDEKFIQRQPSNLSYVNAQSLNSIQNNDQDHLFQLQLKE